MPNHLLTAYFCPAQSWRPSPQRQGSGCWCRVGGVLSVTLITWVTFSWPWPGLCHAVSQHQSQHLFFVVGIYSGEKIGFWTPHALVMHCIELRISPQSPSAVCFSAVTKSYPHAAHSLYHPAQNWTPLATHPQYQN